MADEYPSWVGLVYVFNLIVGTGALTLPAVFAGAGWLLGTVLVALLALVSFITVTFVVESMACANAALRSLSGDRERQVLLEDDATGPNKRLHHLNAKVELGEMAKMYFNRTGLMLFYLSLCVYLYGDLAIYATAISKTVVDLACDSRNNSHNYTVECSGSSAFLKIDVYHVFVATFAACVGPFAYCQIQKTKYLQVFTSGLRWSAFAVMIALTCVKLSKNGPQGHPTIFHLNGVPALIGSSIYSFMCHHSVPGLVTPFDNKQHVVRQLGLDYLLICCFYLLLALTGSFAFEDLEDLYTLNFMPDRNDSSGIFMEAIRYFLGAFPLFTLSTSFPIIAITLQNNLKALFLDSNRTYNFLTRKFLFPTLAVLPPVLVAFSTHNLRTLVAITGSYAGVLIQYIIPTVLVYFGRLQSIEMFGHYDNKYASPFRHVFWLLFVIGWSIFCVIFVTVNLIVQK